MAAKNSSTARAVASSPIPRQAWLLIAVAVGGSSGVLHHGLRSAPAAPASTGVVQGGPFDRVVYHVQTHEALAVPGVFREGDLTFSARLIQFNDVTRMAWTTTPCTVHDQAAAANGNAATADFNRRIIHLSAGVHLELRTPGRPTNVSADCPTLEYHADDRAVTCQGGVHLTLRTRDKEDHPVEATVTAPTLAYQSGPGAMQCSGGVSLALTNPDSAATKLFVSCPALQYESGSGTIQCSGGVDLTSQTRDSDGRPQTAAVRSQMLQYDSTTEKMYCSGGVNLTLRTMGTDGQPGTIKVASPELQYTSSTGEMECTGGTRYSLDATRKDEGPVHLDMAGPTLHYNSKSGELHCEGPVTGDIRGISGIAAESVPVIGIEPGGSPRTAPAPIKSSGPIHVKTADMTYNESTRVLIATKNVDLTQAGTEVQCDLLILDDKQHTLTMSGRFRYSDSQGKKFTGSQAVEHIDKRRVDVSGPVSYSDDQGNSVRSAAAKMQRAIDGSRTVTFSKNVDLKDKEGNHVSTSFLTIETDPKGNQRSIRTGPLNGRGTAKDG